METLLGGILIIVVIVAGLFIWGFLAEYGEKILTFLVNLVGFFGGILLIYYAFSTESKGWMAFGILCTLVGGVNLFRYRRYL
jgi:hypothetical protein